MALIVFAVLFQLIAGRRVELQRSQLAHTFERDERASLLREFQMDLGFKESSGKFYDRFKEEMVLGFSGDSEDWLVANTTLFLITNFFCF